MTERLFPAPMTVALVGGAVVGGGLAGSAAGLGTLVLTVGLAPRWGVGSR